MEKYEDLEMQVVVFNDNDVIVCSDGDEGWGGEEGWYELIKLVININGFGITEAIFVSLK